MDIIKSNIVSLHGAAISMIGGRPENQDDMGYLDTPLGFLIVVCDGMGGGPGGKTASYIVKHEIAETILECSPQTSREHALKMAASRAHQALEDKMKEDPALSGMGSTFVAVLINEQSAVVAHSGDSRCYRLHGKKCLFRTQDHSLVAELVKKKVMTEEDARQSPQANVITRGLGSTNNHVPELDETPYKKGDRFVLCTDGIWGAMRHQKLLSELTQPKDIQILLSDLSLQVDKIGFTKGGGHDNHTIAMFELEKTSQLKERFSWKKWAMIFSIALIIIFICCLWNILGSKEQKRRSTSQSELSVQPSNPSSSENPQYRYSTNSENIGDDNGSDTKVCDNTEVENPNGNKNTDNEKLENASGSNFNEDARKILQEQMGIIDKDSDSSTNQKSNKQQSIKATANSTETTQKIINKYDSAKAVRGNTIEDAQKKIKAKRAEIKELFATLSNLTKDKNNKTRQTVERISNVVDAQYSWDIAKEPDSKSKLYVPTVKAKRQMEKQIERLKELKEIIGKE